MTYTYGSTREEVERRDRAKRRADGLEQQAHALHAEVLRLKTEKAALAKEVEHLTRRRDSLWSSATKARRKLENLQEEIVGVTPAGEVARNRRIWAERYGEVA